MNNIRPGFLLINLVLITCLACNKEKQAVKAPNIIYILADDMGYGDVSANTAKGKILTPNIDRLAKEGMRFTDAHSASSVCTPTRYSTLTGRYNWRTRLKSGVLTGKSKALIPNDRSTVASLLKSKNYYTAFIGKWHLGWDWNFKDPNNFGGEGWDKDDFDNIDFSKPVKNTPNDLGFEYAYGHSGSLDMAPYVYVENGKVTALPDTTTVNTGKYSWWREGPTGSDFVHEEVTPNFFKRAINVVQEKSKGDQPFFIYLALPSPHTPILPAVRWQGKSGINPYGDFVMMIDDYVGQLINAVDAAGIGEETMIVFTTDNGCSPAAKIEELKAAGHQPNGIYRGHKADIYEGGHRVPYLVRWPAKIKANSICEETICCTDLLATCAEIVGETLTPNQGEDSYSLLSLFESKQNGQALREATVHHSINGSFAIRQGDWKLINCAGSGGWTYPTPKEVAKIDTLAPIQLFNLKDDPSETKNVQAQYPEKVEALNTLLVKYIKEGRSTKGPKQENDPIDFEWKQVDFTKH